MHISSHISSAIHAVLYHTGTYLIASDGIIDHINNAEKSAVHSNLITTDVSVEEMLWTAILRMLTMMAAENWT